MELVEGQPQSLAASLLAVIGASILTTAVGLSPVMGALLADWGAPPAVLGVLIAAIIVSILLGILSINDLAG